MSFSDPIAEMLTKVRNASKARHRYVDIPFSKLKVKMLEIIKGHRFVDNFLVSEEKGVIRIFLRYNQSRDSVIQGLERVSKCGSRRYVASTEIPVVFSGMGLSILSTPKGVVDGETARKLNVGGEILCKVW